MDEAKQAKPKIRFFTCMHPGCDFQGEPQDATAPRPSSKKVLMCPSCKGIADPAWVYTQ